MSRAESSDASARSSSSSRLARCSSLSRMRCFIVLSGCTRATLAGGRVHPRALVVVAGQVEEFAHHTAGFGLVLAFGLIEEAGGAVHQLVGETVRQRLEHALRVFALGEQAQRAFEFSLAQGF